MTRFGSSKCAFFRQRKYTTNWKIGSDRAKLRSKTFHVIADDMADQWEKLGDRYE